MDVDLRDYFAIRFAAQLAGGLYPADYIVSRAYDLADAMLAERARRLELDERSALRDEPPVSAAAWPAAYRPALLDELPPPSEGDSAYEIYAAAEREGLDPRWLEPEGDATWELEPKWNGTGEPEARPGLARTQPEAATPNKRERSA
jgi:hypothetical protein